MKHPVILIVEDERVVRDNLSEAIQRFGWQTIPKSSGKDLDQTSLDSTNMAIVDMRLLEGEPQGEEVARDIKQRTNGRVPILVLTGWDIDPNTVQSLSALQIEDYAKKPLDARQLQRRCEVLLKMEAERVEREALRVEATRLRKELEDAKRPAIGVVIDTKMRRTVADIDSHVARSLMPVLVLGDTGTGKEGIAKEIHRASGIADKENPLANFRAVNCAAFTPTLLMSELFGHVKGAFTGAESHRLGLILEAAGVRSKDSDAELKRAVREMMDELLKTSAGDRRAMIKEFSKTKDDDTFYSRVVDAAIKIEAIEKKSSGVSFRQWLELCGNHVTENVSKAGLTFQGLGKSGRGCSGTLFLDEIGDLPLEAQAALLRFLDRSGIQPVGYSGLPFLPDVRIIAATNRASLVVGAPGNRPLNGSEEQGFRPDLLWRLAGWIIELPTLRHRADDAVGAAVRRAAADDEEGQDRYGGKHFQLSAEAQAEIRRMALNSDFSGSQALKSGNFRNLNWLVDRACWITACESSGATEINRETIVLAASQVLELARRHEGTTAPAVGQTERRSSDQVLTNDDQLRQVLSTLAALPAKSLSDFSSEDRAVDVQLVQQILSYLGRSSNESLRRLGVKDLFNLPHNAISDATVALPTAILPRWQYLVFVAALEFCGSQDGREFEWKTAEKHLGAMKEPFRKEIKKLFERFGMSIAFPSHRSSRALRDFAQLVLDDKSTPTFLSVSDATRAMPFRQHLRNVAAAVRLTVSEYGAPWE